MIDLNRLTLHFFKKNIGKTGLRGYLPCGFDQEQEDKREVPPH